MKIITQALVTLIFLKAGFAMATEEPKYTIETKSANYEIRKYEATLVAETLIQDSFDKVGNQAFRILADYIFGNNNSKTKIAMTAPVTQKSASEKIAMTAPVSQVKKENGFLIQFTMPEKYDLTNIPTPIDTRVSLREIPARKVAVYAYSGSWSEENYTKNLSKFKTELDKDGIKTKGDPIFARFNSPFQIWFLRRNEIWLETY